MRQLQLYGAYNYDPKFDALRGPMKLSTPRATKPEEYSFAVNQNKTGRRW